MSSHRLSVAAFPGAANAPLDQALATGNLSAAGLEVEVTYVTSSDQQLELWETGGCDVMHTSPDHLLRRKRAGDPRIVRRDPFGELAVYRRPSDQPLGALRWAVDGLASGYAFVMRALLEERCGLPAAEHRLVAVGGTQQRWEALAGADATVDGTTLHPPFDAFADQAGLQRLAGHLDLLPELATLVTVVRGAQMRSPAVAAYLGALDRAIEQLRAGGVSAVERVLAARGLPPAVAAAGAAGLTRPGGLEVDRTPSVAGLEAFVRLRERYDPDWSVPGDPAALLG